MATEPAFMTKDGGCNVVRQQGSSTMLVKRHDTS